jgi:hypothetical protein
MKKGERYTFFQKQRSNRTNQEWPRGEKTDEKLTVAIPTFVPPPPKKICTLCQQRSSGFRKFSCDHLFCGACAEHHETLFNQCPTCKYVLNPEIHHLFATELPNIPSYDAFEYEPDLNKTEASYPQ